MKESNEIVINCQDCDDRNSLMNILIYCGYEVSIKIVQDDMSLPKRTFYVVAHKLV